MTTHRRGIALPAALAALIVLAALASMANVAARAALREAAGVTDEARAAVARATLRARMEWRIAHTARVELLAGASALGGGDTTLTVTTLAGPWSRLEVRAGGVAVVAELGLVTTPALLWCGAVVAGTPPAVPPHSLSLAPASACTGTSSVVPAARIAEFDSLVVNAVVAAQPDSLVIVSSSTDPQVFRARVRIEIGTSVSIRGVVIAPEVRIAAGAGVQGLVVVRDALDVSPGASIVGDSAAANAAILAHARIRSLGRSGLLLPP